MQRIPNWLDNLQMGRKLVVLHLSPIQRLRLATLRHPWRPCEPVQVLKHQIPHAAQLRLQQVIQGGHQLPETFRRGPRETED